MEQETFNFESTWTLPNAIPDNPEADMREVRRELQIIRQRYTAGALLYPRGTLRDMSKQLKAGHELIAIRGWDGKVVEWPRILKAARYVYLTHDGSLHPSDMYPVIGPQLSPTNR